MNNYNLKDLIENGNYAINCTSPEEAKILAEMLDELYPGEGKHIRDLSMHAGKGGYSKGICFRLELLYDGTFDWGFSEPDWYIEQGRKVGECSLFARPDFGEIFADVSNVYELLFGG